MKEYELNRIETIVRGVCRRGSTILLCRAKGAKTSYLPGGHIEFGEKARAALKREMVEEADINVGIGKFLGVVENLFFQGDKYHAEINLVFEMFIDDNLEVESQEDWITFEWCDVSKLDEAGLLPEDFRRLSSENAEFGI